MSESVEEFLARGGKVDVIAEGEKTFKSVAEHKKWHERQKMDNDYTDQSMREAENETNCRKPYYEN